MRTEIGAVIQSGESIPEDVTDMSDAQSTGGEWPRWVRHDTQDAWDFWWDEERATSWRTKPVEVNRTSADLVAEAAESGWAPFRVTAVREQTAEPEPGGISHTEAQDPQRAEFPALYDHVHQYGDMAARLQLMELFRQRDEARQQVAEAEQEPAAEPEGARDSGGFLRLKGTATGDNQLDPLPAAQPTCPAHGAHPHNGPGVVNGGAVCLDCPICRPPAAEPQPESELHWQPAKPADTPGELVPGEADVPQPVDLLDLVRQHGDLRFSVGTELDGGNDETFHGDRAKANALFARIEAEVQRLRDKQAWLHRELLAITGQRDEAAAERDRACRSRDFMANQVIAPARDALTTAGVEGRTRLADRIVVLVGHRDEALAEVERIREQRDALLDLNRRLAAAPGRTEQARDVDGDPLWIHACGRVEARASGAPSEWSCDDDTAPWRPLLVATESAAPEDELTRLRYEVQRLESDNERLNRIHDTDEKAVMEVLGERDENYEWAERLSQAIAEHLGVDIGEHSNANLPWQAALIALEDAAAPDPLVLRLPEVPEGATLVGIESGRRYTEQDPCADGTRIWSDGPIGGTLGEVLDGEPDGVRVELAPPREPRTWPKLDDQSDDDLPDAVTVDGEVWRRVSSGGVLFSDGTSGMTLAELRTTGDVTEVFDDEAGNR